MRVVALFSGGKDSTYAVHYAQQQGYDVVCLLTMLSKNPESYMYHTLNLDIIPKQAKAMGIKLYQAKTEGEKEAELEDLKEALKRIKEAEGIEGVLSGALASEYQKTRIERICEELGLASISPLWHVDERVYMKMLIEAGFDVRVAGTFAEGLEKGMIGKKLDYEMLGIFERLAIHPAGEGGEYETTVLDGPGFSRALRTLASGSKRGR